MAKKENRGGLLSNEQIEQDVKAKGKADLKTSYSGSQDTGDDGVRQLGAEVQQPDGQLDDEGDN
jgi:hypothetical protein